MARHEKLRVEFRGCMAHDCRSPGMSGSRPGRRCEAGIGAKLTHPQLGERMGELPVTRNDSLDPITSHSKCAPSQRQWLSPFDGDVGAPKSADRRVRKKSLCIIAALALFQAIATAALAQQAMSLEGGRGLLSMNSARTVESGHYAVGLQWLGMQRKQRALWDEIIYGEPTDYPTILTFQVALGLAQNMDLTGSINYYRDVRVFNDPGNVFKFKGKPKVGFGSARAVAKVRLPGMLSDRLLLAVRFGATFDTSPENLDGMNYRWVRDATDIDCSLIQTIIISQTLSLHLEEGYVVSGDEWFDDQAVFSAGIEYDPPGRWALGLELDTRTFLSSSPMAALWEGPYPWKYSSPENVGDPRALNDDAFDFGSDYLVLSPSVRCRLTDSATLNLGVLINLAQHQPYPKETAQFNACITLNGALRFLLDSDGDGVRDSVDREKMTPKGYPVDGYGVSLDSDGDGVPDGRDRQQNTPEGAVVDADGVGKDSDGDGLYDGIDREPNTPRGYPVDEFGVALDSDGDGVHDGMDREPGTPRGFAVDRYGVALDSDGDGVPDGRDIEPKTPRGLEVDEYGCAISREEKKLIEESMITVFDVRFRPGRSAITGEDSYEALGKVAHILAKYPSLRIIVGGHTDNQGDPVQNIRLSRERAQSVLDFMLKHRPELDRGRFTVVGYGPYLPIASNDTKEGRQLNRRVTFEVTNWQELRKLLPQD